MSIDKLLHTDLTDPFSMLLHVYVATSLLYKYHSLLMVVEGYATIQNTLDK